MRKKGILRFAQNDTAMVGLGKKIAAGLKGGDVVLLYGELGAGKTTLTKGIAAGLGIKKRITSPTFTLMNVYKIINHPPIRSGAKIINLVHIDTYRLENEKQLIEIGAEDYIGDSETVCVIEWAEKVSGLVKGKRVKEIFIEVEGERRIVKISDK